MVDTPRTTGASLTDKEIAEYQRLFKAEFGINLTKDQALEKGLRLVRLLRVVLEGDVKDSLTLSDKHL